METIKNNKMEEYSFLKEKKQNAEFITPPILRDFLRERVGDASNKIIFDPACGSGQLLFGIKAKKKIGLDINDKSIKAAISNGIEAEVYDYITYDDTNLSYDYVISNYPYSLRATLEQAAYLKNKYKLKKWTGVLDFEFILKSFAKADKGFYLCFPGIGYRATELKYRKQLIENNQIHFIKTFTKPLFKDTRISILYIELHKNKIDKKITICDDLDNSITLNSDDPYFVENEYKFNYHFETKNPINDIDINAVEEELARIVKRRNELETQIDNIIKDCKSDFPSFPDYVKVELTEAKECLKSTENILDLNENLNNIKKVFNDDKDKIINKEPTLPFIELENETNT